MPMSNKNPYLSFGHSPFCVLLFMKDQGSGIQRVRVGQGATAHARARPHTHTDRMARGYCSQRMRLGPQGAAPGYVPRGAACSNIDTQPFQRTFQGPEGA